MPTDTSMTETAVEIKAGGPGSKHRYVYIQVSKYDPPFDRSRCAESVAEGGRSIRSLQCRRKWVVQEEGWGWCKQHSIAEQEKRNAASAERYRAERAADPLVRLVALANAAGTTDQDELVLLILAGRRWMNEHAACPQHGLVNDNHMCRDYDGQSFGPGGYAPQGYAAARPFLSVTEHERAINPIPEIDTPGVPA